MPPITIAVAADHRGFSLKTFLRTQTTFGDYTVTWQDLGTDTQERTDYPLYAKKIVPAIQDGAVPLGILICGTGIGMAIAANRFPGIYAGATTDPEIARRAREEDNMNVLVIPADYCTQEQAVAVITAWLNASFKGGRYAERLALF